MIQVLREDVLKWGEGAFRKVKLSEDDTRAVNHVLRSATKIAAGSCEVEDVGCPTVQAGLWGEEVVGCSPEVFDWSMKWDEATNSHRMGLEGDILEVVD